MLTRRLAYKPGQDTTLSFSAARDRWVGAALGRWREGMPETMTGWVGICRQPTTGIARGLHYWSDLTGAKRFGIGTNSRLYVLPSPNPGAVAETLTEITPNGFAAGAISSPVGSPFTLLIWSLDNFGQNLIACPSGGTIYSWVPALAGTAQPLVGAPAVNQGCFVESQRQIIVAYGCTPVIGGGADPMQIRWCNQSDPNTWIAAPSNQAGSFRLPTGNRIIGAISMPNVSLIWTDQDLWSMSYIGLPEVYSFTTIGKQCGLIAQKACVVMGGMPFWMGQHGFFTLGGSGPTPLPCPVWDNVFKDLDTNNQDKCFAATNYHYNEVYFFYPSLSGGTGEIDSFVKLNIQTGEWDFSGNGGVGKPNVMARTCWTDLNVPGDPISTDLNGKLVQSEQGYTQDGAGFVPASFQTGFQDIADGGRIWAVDQFIPDFIWSGPAPSLNLTILFRHYSGDTITAMGPFTVTPITQKIKLRLPEQRTYGDSKTNYTTWAAPRAREIAFKVDNATAGFWRWGAPRIKAFPAGLAG